MRHPVISMLLFLALLGLSPGVRAEEPGAAGDDAEAQGWGRYGVGTTIHHRTTTESTVPGMEPQRILNETKKTLIRITDTHYVLESETTMAGRTQTSEEKVPKTGGPDALARVVPFAAGTVKARKVVGRESVTVAGTEYDCTKVELTFPCSPNARGSSCGGSGTGDDTFVTTIWEHPTHGLLKMMSTGGWGMDLETAALDAEHEVDGRALRCKATTLSREGMVTKRLDCREVPGELVRSEVSIEQGPMKSRALTELVAFTPKPR